MIWWKGVWTSSKPILKKVTRTFSKILWPFDAVTIWFCDRCCDHLMLWPFDAVAIWCCGHLIRFRPIHSFGIIVASFLPFWSFIIGDCSLVCHYFSGNWREQQADYYMFLCQWADTTWDTYFWRFYPPPLFFFDFVDLYNLWSYHRIHKVPAQIIMHLVDLLHKFQRHHPHSSCWYDYLRNWPHCILHKVP